MQIEEQQTQVLAIEHGRQITNLRLSWGIDCASHYRDKQFPRVPLSPQAEKLLCKMETGLKRAMRQVEVSRLELHKFQLSLQRENLVTIVQETVANQQQAARTRQIELVLPPEELVLVNADAGRVVVIRAC